MKKALWIAVVGAINLAALPWTWRFTTSIHPYGYPFLLFGAHAIISALSSLPFAWWLKEARREEPLELRRKILSYVPEGRTATEEQRQGMKELR